MGFDKNQLTVYHDGWKLEQDASQDEVKQALGNAAMFQSFLQQVAYRVNAFDILMAGTRRAMCAAFLIRSFFAFFIQLPLVVIPSLDVDAQMIHGLGSMEWDSDTEAEKGPDEPERESSDEPDKKRSKFQEKDASHKRGKGQSSAPAQDDTHGTQLFCGPENRQLEKGKK